MRLTARRCSGRSQAILNCETNSGVTEVRTRFVAFPVPVRRLGERLDHMEQELVALARAVRELVQVVAHQEALRTRLVAIGERHEATLAKWRVIAQRHAERVGRLVAMTERHRRTSVELRQSARRHDDRLECLTQLRQRQGRELREMRSEIGSSTVMISAMVEADAADAVVAARARKGHRISVPSIGVAPNSELDLPWRGADPSGRAQGVIVEATVQLHRQHSLPWTLQSPAFLARPVQEDGRLSFLADVVGQRGHRDAVQAAAAWGIGLLSCRGERVAPSGLVG